MKKLLVYSLFLLISSQILGSGTKNVSIDFELSETAINRAIVSQFNDPNFAFKHFTGTCELLGVVDVPYSVELARPSIVIGEQSIGIHLAFSFQASIGNIDYNYDFDITPSITVNDASITGSAVVAFLNNLEVEINAHTEIEPEIRDLLILLYNNFEPQVYASKLFNEVLTEINSNEFIAQRAFSITDFGISTAFVTGKFVVRAMAEITYESTLISSVLVIQNNGSEERLIFYSNFKCTLDKIYLQSYAGSSSLYNVSDLNIELIMNPNPEYDYKYYADVDLNDIIYSYYPTNIYLWNVLFKTNATFYFNQYKSNAYTTVLPYKKTNY